MLRFRNIIFVVCCVVTVPALAAQYPVNEMPMYGGVEKTPAMLAADEQFIKTFLEEGYSRIEGALRMSKRGWESFSKGDISTAVKRFNQSWLLDPDMYSTYWGFALVYLLRDDDVQNAAKMFEKAASLEPVQANFYIEYGRFLEENDRGSNEQVIALLRKGLDLNPRIRDGYIGLIRVCAKNEDMEQARFWYYLAKENGIFTASEIENYNAIFAGGKGM